MEGVLPHVMLIEFSTDGDIDRAFQAKVKELNITVLEVQSINVSFYSSPAHWKCWQVIVAAAVRFN